MRLCVYVNGRCRRSSCKDLYNFLLYRLCVYRRWPLAKFSFQGPQLLSIKIIALYETARVRIGWLKHALRSVQMTLKNFTSQLERLSVWDLAMVSRDYEMLIHPSYGSRALSYSFVMLPTLCSQIKYKEAMEGTDALGDFFEVVFNGTTQQGDGDIGQTLLILAT